MLYRPYAVVTELVGQNDLLDAIAYDLSFVLWTWFSGEMSAICASSIIENCTELSLHASSVHTSTITGPRLDAAGPAHIPAL